MAFDFQVEVDLRHKNCRKFAVVDTDALMTHRGTFSLTYALLLNVGTIVLFILETILGIYET